MSHHSSTIEVDRPLEVVYDQWTQFEEFPSFMNGVEEVAQIDDKRNHWKVSIAGVEREFDTVIVEQEPGRKIAWSSISGAKVSGEVDFERVDAERTAVTLVLDFEPEGVTEKVGAAVGVVGAQASTDLSRFKEFIESRERPTGGWSGEIHGGAVTPDEGGGSVL